ncbi:MAG: class I SAM-dependent methyltransferase [Candidatus Eremiobacteraeota bacterium]|nr:class I SAM-dependent methyltransferase [Candidatus Eremiobacteraeota bacterium]
MKPNEAQYHLGYSDEEHERLIRQAKRLAPVSERFFREAGVDTGQAILDVGSGVGDVAMLAARIVGPSGSVVAVERDERSIERARQRAAREGLTNITFVHAEIDDYAPDSIFDAAIGRYVLQFLPRPAVTLRALAARVRPGGIVAFQEGSWIPFVALSAHVPLWSATVEVLREAAVRAGVDVEMGVRLHAIFQEAGLPAPRMRLEMELGDDPDFTRWLSDCIRSVLPQIRRFDLRCEALGDLDTLERRLHEEVSASNSVVPWIGLVGAWSKA